MKPFLILVALSAGSFLTACGPNFNEGCPIFETRWKSWERNITLTHRDTLFQNTRYPLDSRDSAGLGYARADIYHIDPYADEWQDSLSKLPPRVLEFILTVSYSPEALAHWIEDEYLPADFDPLHFNRREFVHIIRLESPTSLKKGVYAFSPLDTADGLSLRMEMELENHYQDKYSFTLPPRFSGYIRIDKDFTAKYGKAQYYAEVLYGDGQRSAFSGTVVFDGITYTDECL